LRLYVDISQIFRIFIIPFYSANVTLVTVLDLAWDEQLKVYRIKHQNDLYQVNQWVKFISPFNGFFVVLLQFIATLICVVSATILAPITLVEQKSVEASAGPKMTNGLDD
jgi:hypothetical protein